MKTGMGIVVIVVTVLGGLLLAQDAGGDDLQAQLALRKVQVANLQKALVAAQEEIAGLKAKLAPAVGPKSKATGKPYVIDDYSFDWVLWRDGDAGLRIEKTQDTTRVRLSANMNRLGLSGAEAEAVGAVLAKTEAVYARLRAAGKDTSEKVKAGGLRVDFDFSQKFGFSAWVIGKGLLAERIRLTKKHAVAVQPHLAQASALCDFVDRRVRP